MKLRHRLLVVNHCEVFEDDGARIVPYCVDVSLDSLAGEYLEEVLCHRIFVGVAAATHAGLMVVRIQKVFPVVAPVLAALVAMARYHRSWLSSPSNHQQCIQYELGYRDNQGRLPS